MNNKIIINISVIFVLFLLIIIFGLDIKTPYPKEIVVYFNEPMVKIGAYVLIYHISYYNPIISIMLLLLVLMVHTDLYFLK